MLNMANRLTRFTEVILEVLSRYGQNRHLIAQWEVLPMLDTIYVFKYITRGAYKTVNFTNSILGHKIQSWLP